MMHGTISDGITKLFVGGIQPTCKENDIRQALSAYSQEILKVDIKMKNNLLNKGYAFIFVTSPEVADRMTKMKFKLKDRILQVQNVNKNSREKEEYKMKRLYLKNLPDKTSDKELFDFFERFGEVRSSYIIKDRFGQNRDYGFIDFEHVEDVDKCLGALKKLPFVLRGNKIKVRRFIKLDDKNENQQETDVGSARIIDEPHNTPYLGTNKANAQEEPQAEAFGDQHWQSNTLQQGNISTGVHPEAKVDARLMGLVVPPCNLSSSSSKRRIGFQNDACLWVAAPTGCPPSHVASPFLVRGSIGHKALSDDSFSKGHPAYPFDQTHGIKKGKSQEFEEDYDFLIMRDYSSYQSDIELNHNFTNLRLNLRRIQVGGRRGPGGQTLFQAN